ncbi:MAG: hypothetical protein JSS58_04950 [Proteobacteria bacterium]|nr:hypothetical protein [Pseudomonadota bacterium]
MEKLFLSQRDLLTLLGKLDDVRDGQPSSCTIIKSESAHPIFPQTLRRIAVVATETADRYLPGVSPRLHLARASLALLLERVARQTDETILVGEVNVAGVADARYYVDRSAEEFAPVGDMNSAFMRGRGK